MLLIVTTHQSKVLFSKRSIKMIDGSKKCNRHLAFELQNSHVCEERSKLAGTKRPMGRNEPTNHISL